MQDQLRDGRPDPDALLALTANEKRGRLWVFLGAAPGVGKTYAMLQRARMLQAQGRDVVVGLVETHGRAETEALVAGLEVLPRRQMEWQGRTIEEFDLDAALQRKPSLIVVDELAHTNAPDSRHPKRWQDVDELLDARIDVWTALNIQHVESLADVVSRITGVRVRETVPDTILRDADDIILVDIAAEELIKRLQDGKVYLPQTAQRAQNNFFTLRNLTALRELALRRTAARVDDQMVAQLRQSSIQGPWETAERLMVCLGPDDLSQEVVRVASRLATGLNAGWVAVTVEPADSNLDPRKAKLLDEAQRLAERLGADFVRLSGLHVPDTLLQYAQRENITQIVVGRSQAGRFGTLLGRSLSDALVRRADQIGVHVVPGGPGRATQHKTLFKLFQWRAPTWTLLAAPLSVSVAVAIGTFLDWWLKLPNLSMVFLIAVLFCAVRFGLQAAILASILSFLAYDFFFIAPIYTFTIQEPQEFFALLMFLGVAILTGWQTGQARDQSKLARDHARTTQSLFELSRKLSGALSLGDILDASTIYAQKTLGAACVVMLLPEGGNLQAQDLTLQSAWPPHDDLGPGDRSAALWAFQKRDPAGWQTGTLPNIRFQFRPLVTPRGVVGVCGFEMVDRLSPLSATQERALGLILEQTAIAVDRAVLISQSLVSAALQENEKLRGVLLASLSHDLRTPLAAITGAVTTLQQFGATMEPAQQRDLLNSIEEEAARLTRFIANLLDMSRIEAGALKPRRDLVDIAESVRAATDRAMKIFPTQAYILSLAQGLPLVRADANLLEQVLFNLLDNAQKYGGGSKVTVHARATDTHVIVSVTDEGQGIKPTDLEKVFEKFYQGGRVDGRKAGTGLGLSICRGLVEAMGGTIWAESPAVRRRGTRIVVQLPSVPIRSVPMPGQKRNV